MGRGVSVGGGFVPEGAEVSLFGWRWCLKGKRCVCGGGGAVKGKGVCS